MYKKLGQSYRRGTEVNGFSITKLIPYDDPRGILFPEQYDNPAGGLLPGFPDLTIWFPNDRTRNDWCNNVTRRFVDFTEGHAFASAFKKEF